MSSCKALDTPTDTYTHPLNTPSGQTTTDYFASRRAVLFNHLQDKYGPSTSDGSVEPLRGSLLDLPNELLCRILEFGCFDHAGSLGPDDKFLALASKLSHKFRALVLETTSFWSVIHLSFANVTKELDFLPTRLQWSKMHPLTVQLSCYWDAATTEEIMDKLLPHIERWSKLSVTIANKHLFTLLENKPAPFLEYLSISYYAHDNHVSLPPHVFGDQLPRLKHLSLRHVDIGSLGFSLRGLRTLEIRGYGTWPRYARLNEMLGGTTELQELILHVSSSRVLSQIYEDDAIRPPLYLPELRRLTVYTSEWLHRNIAGLVSVFACPKLETFYLHESNSTEAFTTPPSIMAYARDAVSMAHVNQSHDDLRRAGPQPMRRRFPLHLFMHTCELYHGCSALPSVNLTTLELHGVQWPKLEKLKEIFTNLKNLTNLFIYDLDPRYALLSILDGTPTVSDELKAIDSMVRSVPFPVLSHLSITLNESDTPPPSSPPFWISTFFGLFSLPALDSLHLARLSSPKQLSTLLEVIGENPKNYPSFTSLSLSDMPELVNPDDPVDLVGPLEHVPLRALALDGVDSCTALLRQLIPATPGEWKYPPFPDLTTLSIARDAFVSKPLLHRVVKQRSDMGMPLFRLLVDRHFCTNRESLEWLKEHIEQVDVYEEQPPDYPIV